MMKSLLTGVFAIVAIVALQACEEGRFGANSDNDWGAFPSVSDRAHEMDQGAEQAEVDPGADPSMDLSEEEELALGNVDNSVNVPSTEDFLLDDPEELVPTSYSTPDYLKAYAVSPYLILDNTYTDDWYLQSAADKLLFVSDGQARMIIGDTGFVSIGAVGAAAPQSKLELAKNATSADEIALRIEADGEFRTGLRFLDDDSSTQWFDIEWDASGEDLHFSHHDNLDIMTITDTGRVGINTNSPDHALDVHGTVRAEEIIVEMFTPDYVFEKNYDLMTLREVDTFVSENGHLPGMPSAADVNEFGVNLADSHARLLQKVEELTLHAIAQEQRLEGLEKQNTELRSQTGCAE